MKNYISFENRGGERATMINSELRIGTDNDSYINISKDGNVELIGNATSYTDLLVPVTSTKVGSNNKPDFDEDNVGYLFPQNDDSEILYFIAQFPHDRNSGTHIYPHVHWDQDADQTPVFKIDYKFYDNGGDVPASFSTHTISTKVFDYDSGTLAQISRSADYINGSSITGLSPMIIGKLYRDDNAYTGDVLVKQLDFHYEVDGFGSNTEYSK